MAFFEIFMSLIVILILISGVVMIVLEELEKAEKIKL